MTTPAAPHSPDNNPGHADAPVDARKVQDALDVIVIGAGQAGLAVAWHLAQQHARFVVLDAAPQLGHSWRTRWDSLRLFSPAQYDSLPGMDFPAALDTYPGKDDVADYLTGYAEQFQLPILLGHRVTRLQHHPTTNGQRPVFTVHTSHGPLRARQVVVATGAFQKPHRPSLADALDDRVVQVHSAHYRNPDQLPPGPVLVVGAGNSGLQIAEELATHPTATGSSDKDRGPERPVHLAVGATPPQLPQRFAGRDLFWWLSTTGAITRPATSLLVRRMRARGDVVIGTNLSRVKSLGVTARSRVTGAGPLGVEFADGTRLAPASVIWSTGFTADYTWMDVPGVITDTPRGGTVIHKRGVTAVPGLYFIGLPWQHSRGSALLGFVRHDAAWLADRLYADRTQLHGL